AGDKSKIFQAFGKVIEEHRIERNLSQAELAELGDFNRTYISDLERGLKQASLSTIFRLAYAFDITPSKLIEDLEKKIEL
ncbi:MAG: helix-turn-helix transcriptional regulator, partial [Candidatus Paceibacterota bacterium]